MAKKTSYKKKNQLLVVVAPLFLFLSYQLAIKKTWDVRESCAQLESELKDLAQAPEDMNRLEMELKKLESWIGQGQTDDQYLQTKVLKIVNDYCYREGITVKEFSEPEITQEENYSVETTTIIVNGPFVKILNLAYAFEQKFRLGKLVSLRFEVEKNQRDKVNELIGTLYVRNIKKIVTKTTNDA